MEILESMKIIGTIFYYSISKVESRRIIPKFFFVSIHIVIW